MSSTGSISLSGLIGGTAGSIDTTSLVAQLMQAQALPQTQLQDQLSTVTSQLGAYQAINSKLTAVQTAAQALTDPTSWKATTATSSSSAVAATSSSAAVAGSTTFSISQLARSQVTTVSADSSGTVVSVPSSGIRITGSDGTAHNISLTSGSASDVASAINAANVGVRASVVVTNNGVVLQMSSTKSGTANGFSLDGTDSAPKNVVAAQDAQATVGDPANGGYAVNSSSNTFTNLIPGVTFSANALANDVTITVGSDSTSISNKVQALVSAANAALAEISGDTAQGAVLQSHYDARSIASSLTAAVANGIAGGGSLKTYGIDLNSTGQFSFDPAAFASAYAADPTGTQAAVSGSFASNLNATTSAAVAPVTGTITSAVSAAATRSQSLTTEINNWTTKLATIKDNLTAKYAAMETALGKLQSQQTYITSMLKSATSSGDSSS